MKIIEPSVLVRPFDGLQIMRNIEWAGRVAYKSEGKITADSYDAFIRRIIKSGHESVLEHEKLTVKFVVDRGVSHEIVRHRIASFTQESTRYCNYGHAGEITVINPLFWPVGNAHGYEWFDSMKQAADAYDCWHDACRDAETAYMSLLDIGATPQEARSVLPNSLKTEVVMTANIREWRHFFSLRTDKAAHPQMRQVAIPLLLYLKKEMPALFDGISYDEDFDPENYVAVRVISKGCDCENYVAAEVARDEY